MVVSSLADDVLDSMNPRDTDGDGVAEDRGPLGTSGEDLEPFLPDEERDRRRKAAKHVKWAINVSDRKTRETQYGLLRMNRSTLSSTSSYWEPRESPQSGPTRFLSSHPWSILRSISSAH
jgi:hypothetical protein